MTLNDTTLELLELLQLDSSNVPTSLQQLNNTESRYIRDLKVNVSNVLRSNHLNAKETALLALSVAANNKNEILSAGFGRLAESHDATAEERTEAIACASLLAANNVFYRFRHFIEKETYSHMPGKIKMNIMMKPVLGKEFFELMSLAVSAVNGCEMCVKAHEESVLKLGSSEERIWDAIRLASVITSLDKIIN